MYYARYDVAGSDVAVFKTRKERDGWVREKDFFDRIPISEEEAAGIVNINDNLVEDSVNKSVKWLVFCK